MIGRTNAASGGSGGVRLTIVGGTVRPTNPAMNTVWVNTEHEITGYSFSATEPETPADGMLWVKIGNSGATKIHEAIGKEWLTVYLNSAKQYVSGAWVVRFAECYQNGTWDALLTYMYDRGKYGLGGIPAQIYKDKASTVSLNADNISIDLQNNGTNRAGFPEAVDFSKHSTMTAIVKVPSTWNRAVQFRMGVDSDKHTSAPFVARAINEFTANQEYLIVLDVSTYNEKSKVWFELNNATGTLTSGTLNVLEMYFE